LAVIEICPHAAMKNCLEPARLVTDCHYMRGAGGLYIRPIGDVIKATECGWEAETVALPACKS
jgi:hypothetical protein